MKTQFISKQTIINYQVNIIFKISIINFNVLASMILRRRINKIGWQFYIYILNTK